MTNQVFQFEKFANAVTRYGYGGLSHLSQSLMKHVLNCLFERESTDGDLTGEQERILELYTNSSCENEKTSVDYLLAVGVLFCAH